MVDVKITGAGERLPGERIEPSARHNAASTVIHFNWLDALRDQHLLPRVLTVSVIVNPVTIQVAVVRD